MSVNIQTANGLVEIGGNVTKNKIVNALGYTPADESHVSDTDIHVSKTDRANWNNKDYNLLENTPNIIDDGSGNLTIADNDNNAIAKFDENGLTTTDINTNSISLNGEDLGAKLDELASGQPNIVDDGSDNLLITDNSGNAIMKVDKDGLTVPEINTNKVSTDELYINEENIVEKIEEHTSNDTIHVTETERQTWNSKSDFSGDYNDLDNSPNIIDDGSGNFVIQDDDGNPILQVDVSGLATTYIKALSLELNGENIGSKIEGKSNIGHKHEEYLVADDIVNKANKSELHEHSNKDILDEIDADKISSWDNKSDFDGEYNSLKNTPHILDDESEEFTITDDSNNPIFKVDKTGAYATEVYANKIDTSTLLLNSVDITETFVSKNQGVDNYNKVMVVDSNGDVVPGNPKIEGAVESATKLSIARTLTIGNTGKEFDGSKNVSWSLDEIGAENTTKLRINTYSSDGINDSNAFTLSGDSVYLDIYDILVTENSDNKMTLSLVDMKGATSTTAGHSGSVPAPAVGKQDSFLRGDGKWEKPVVDTIIDFTPDANSSNGVLLLGHRANWKNWDVGIPENTSEFNLEGNELVALPIYFASANGELNENFAIARGWWEFPEGIKADVEGNADTSTKLKTARDIEIKLNGKSSKASFDGSKAVTIDLGNVGENKVILFEGESERVDLTGYNYSNGQPAIFDDYSRLEIYGYYYHGGIYQMVKFDADFSSFRYSNTSDDFVIQTGQYERLTLDVEYGRIYATGQNSANITITKAIGYPYVD